MTVEMLDLHEIPRYDANVEEPGDPPAVTMSKEGLRNANSLRRAGDG